MGFREKSLLWRGCYIVCCLAYLPWVVYLSLNDFDMVHSQYHRTKKRVQPAQIEQIARQELVDQCRKALRGKNRQPIAGDDSCLSLPTVALEARQKVVTERLTAEQRRAGRKIVVFYLTFLGVFLILPVFLLYQLFTLLSWTIKTIRGIE